MAGGKITGYVGSRFSNNDWALYSSAGTIFFQVYESDGTEKSSTGAVISSDNWHHLVGVANGTHVTVYVDGTGDWNVEVSPDQGIGPWIAVGSDVSGDGYYSTIDPHCFMRVVLRNGANADVWLFKKYATY